MMDSKAVDNRRDEAACSGKQQGMPGGIHEVLQLCYVALGSHNGEGTVNMSFMMKNREGETPYCGMMHWIPVMSFDV